MSDKLKVITDLIETYLPDFQLQCSPGGWYPSGGWGPHVDISETEDTVIVKAEIPGAEKSDIEISIVDNVLKISGNKKMRKEEHGESYSRVECSYGMFSRSFTLPTSVDSTSATAKYSDGVLVITIPKTGTTERGQDIPIE